jgi:hypothetical protein
MTDDLHIPRRLESEEALLLNPIDLVSNVNTQSTDIAESGIHTLDQVSLEAVINVLLKRGVCTEAELFAEENRLCSVHQTMDSFHFTPVQIPNEGHSHKSHDHNSLRRWASKYRWSRRLGSILFGWKWHRKKKM